MSQIETIQSSLSHLKPELVSAMLREGVLKDIPAGTEILREGQYVKVIPIVIKGLIKVLTRHDDKELLLYYIRPKESCIMSFAAGLKNEPSRVFASTEEDTKALLLPVDKVSKWTAQFPDINNLFFQQYNMRYADLLDTIHHVLFDKLDKRLYDYLVEKVALTKQNPLKMSHREIANELATSREVISRAMKKLELENLLKQHSNSIELLNR